MIAYYNKQPEEIQYMSLPDGKADVWLRKGITEVETEETDTDGNTVTGTQWECEEISFRTSLTKDEITENLDTIWENGGVVTDEDTEEEVIDGVTLKERVEADEEAIAELADIIAELAG